MLQPMAEQIEIERVLRHRRGLAAINPSELWRYRELLVFFAWRDILVRYKQTYLGIAWAVLPPLLTMLVFTVIFGRFAKFPSNGAPYAVLTFAALLPWQFFANALTESSGSLVASMMDVHEHQADPYAIMKLIRHYLSPGGSTFLSIPYADSVQGKLFKSPFRSRWEMVMPPTHCQFFTGKNLGILLAKSRFSIQKIVQFNYSDIPFFNRWERVNAFLKRAVDRLSIGDQIVFTIMPDKTVA